MEKIITNVLWAIIKPMWYAVRFIKAIGEWLWYNDVFKAIGFVLAIVGMFWLGTVIAQVIAFCWGW